MRVIGLVCLLVVSPLQAQGIDPAAAAEASRQLPERLCQALAQEPARILNDPGDTHKYLSPYVAQDIYEGLVEASLRELPPELRRSVRAPDMSSLPCQDTVSDVMMAIKKRMDYGRFDRFLLGNRVRIAVIAGVLVLMIGLYWHWARRHPREHT
jgi:hypothetical protein